jgi:diguanylate cyclase (GGDEF)-like protein
LSARGPSSHRILIAFASGLVVAAALAMGFSIWWLRSQAINNASRYAGSLAAVLAEETNRSVQSIDLVLNEVHDRLSQLDVKTPNDFRRQLQGEDTYRLLTERMARLSQVASISLIDKNGIIVNSTAQWPMPPTDISDREHFKYVKKNNIQDIYISSPITERTGGMPTVFFYKRVNDANNEFLGIISIGVRLNYFEHIYGSIKSLHDMSFLFLRKDGTVLVRYPDSNTRAGEKLPARSPWYWLVSQGGGEYQSPGYFDGVARQVAVRPLQDYPLVVNVAASETAALATWRVQAMTFGIGTLFVILCFALLLKELTKQFGYLAASKSTLVKKTNELERANLKADAALNNMSQGICMFDAAQRLIVCNKRYAELYGLSVEQTKPGTTLRTILGHRVARGAAPQDKEKYIVDRINEVTRNESYQTTNELSDGRYISVVHQPMLDGGWVATHADVTDWKRAEQRVTRMAHHDLLTELPNRATFNETINAALEHAATAGKQFAVLSIDLDRFKEANDTYGHLVGDALLREVARRLQVAAEKEFIARIGGDEFIVIVASGPQPAAAMLLAERLLAVCEDDFEAEGHQLTLGMSIGGAVYPTDGTDAKTLMGNADTALYRAKAETPGSVVFFESEMGARLRERRTLQEDLRAAIDRGELLLHYQPQKKMSGETIGFEALVRWQCPKRGMVAPNVFIPIAEESGLIFAIDEWVLRAACREAASWPQPMSIAVNISPMQFRKANLPRLVHSILLETGLATGRLELEITESVMINDLSRAVSILNQLKSLGVRIAMDDFGTGYSSLSYLQSFKCDKIKIDRVFISDLERNYHSKAIVRAVIGLGQSLNLPILAEGVETQAQHAYLMHEGCDEVQGYLTGRPLPIANYAELIGRQPSRKTSYATAS